MNYKRSFFTLVGVILLYSFYSFVETQKYNAITNSKSEQPLELAPAPPQMAVVAPTPVIERIEPVAKKESAEVRHRKNVAAFEKETTMAYYSDGKIVAYQKKMRKQEQIEERNLENEFAKLGR